MADRFPIQVVTAWIGNSVAVAKKHYLQVTDNHFETAAGGAGGGAGGGASGANMVQIWCRASKHPKAKTPRKARFWRMMKHRKVQKLPR